MADIYDISYHTCVSAYVIPGSYAFLAEYLSLFLEPVKSLRLELRPIWPLVCHQTSINGTFAVTIPITAYVAADSLIRCYADCMQMALSLAEPARRQGKTNGNANFGTLFDRDRGIVESRAFSSRILSTKRLQLNLDGR